MKHRLLRFAKELAYAACCLCILAVLASAVAFGVKLGWRAIP